MNEKTLQDNRNLVDFWDKVLSLTDEDREGARQEGAEIWKEMAPSEKLFRAAASLADRKKVLDYGCGNGWAGIIAAKSGCPDVTAADMAPGAVRSAEFYASVCGAEGQVHAEVIHEDWLKSVPAGTYDGIVCSNVLDVVPTETAEDILRELARVAVRDAAVIIGLNFYMSPEAAAQRGTELEDGCKLYADGVLRLVSRSDEEWERIFAPFFTVDHLEHFAWPGETAEKRRLFHLRKREDG